MIYRQIICVALCAASLQARAQLELSPVQKPAEFTGPEQARKKSLSPMPLPFWDDFSAHAHTDTLWESYATVWINNGMAIDPPSINVATFDGLNANGIPYSPNPNQNLDYGFTDSLISRRIKMTDVNLFERNSVFLSFYYQWGGNGEPPDANDYLRLEFLNADGDWEAILTLQSDTSQRPDEFYSVTYRINQDRFFHDDFRFRFRSYGRQSGRYDTWNVDYIYMNKGRDENDLSSGFPDRAATQLLSPLFGSYYAIPFDHFLTDPEVNMGLPAFRMSNLSFKPQPMNYSVDAAIIRFTDGNQGVQSFPVTVNETIATLEGFEKRDITMTKKADLLPFLPADSLLLTYTVMLNTSDTINTGFEPIDFLVNDTIRQTYVLKDYYAYDDGSAEYAAGLTQSGNQVAYRFIMKTNTQDTVNGVYIHYPFTSGKSASIATLLIWDNQDGVPGNVLLEELIPVQQRTDNEFILRSFIQAVIVKDTFFIGWRHPVSGRVQVGLDASQDTGDQMFVNVNNVWVQNTIVKGSLMIRPRFGTGDVITSVTESQPSTISIYPNPNSGAFFIEGNPNYLQIFSASGQPVDFEQEELQEKKRIQLYNPQPGLYIIRYHTGNRFHSEKIIIR